jgi:hypothetical protein
MRLGLAQKAAHDWDTVYSIRVILITLRVDQ